MTQKAMWVSSVTIGAPDPRELARFYERLLGWTITELDGPPPGAPPESGWAQLRAPDDTPGLMTINLEYEQGYVRPVWPSTPGEQQIQTHLDLPVENLAAAEQHALEAGAVLAEFQPQKHVRVMLDPAGHPFCLFQI